MKLTPEEWRLVNDNGHRMVRRLVMPDESSELGEIVFKISVGDKPRNFTVMEWEVHLEKLLQEKRPLREWVDAQLG